MEFILKKETCRDFLNNYHKEIYPILLPKIIEIGILTLKLSFNKVLFSPDELNDIISSLNQQYNSQKQKISSLNSKPKKQKHLNNNNLTLDNEEYPENNQQNQLFNSISFNERNFLKDDEKYLNTIDTSNFYDSDYFIPETKSFRNKQLYNKRLENPMFNTLNKNVYPFWWWNQTEPEYLIKKPFNTNQKILKGNNVNNKKEINKRNNNNNKNYFNLKNKTNYKISYDKNLNVIKIETGKKRKIPKKIGKENKEINNNE